MIANQMRNSSTRDDPARPADDGIPLLTVGTVVLRHRRMIAILTLVGAIAGLSAGLLSRRVYTSTAVFIPQNTENGGTSGLALAASQFGIKVPGADAGWGPAIYVELLQSRSLLEPILTERVAIPGEPREVTVEDLLHVTATSPPLREDRAIRALRNRITATEDKRLGAVRLSVATEWAPLSLLVAERLVSGVNRFNLESRKSQALAERRFVEGQTTEAEGALHAAEDRLREFLTSNRGLGTSPDLTLTRDRLQRDVSLRQQVYTTLVQSLQEARIREVRDTPVITVLEAPRLAVAREARGTVQKILIGVIVGAVLGLLLAFLRNGWREAKAERGDDAREFFLLVEQATPRFLRRGTR
jgi:uncharacterized protein involved in exopolysaccharide biosynthesis